MTDDRQPILHIVRGLPGSGKTTYANRLGCLVVSPQDHYAMRGGRYEWRPSNEGRSWRMGSGLVWHALDEGCDVAVAECLPATAEVAPLLHLARMKKARPRIIDLVISPAESRRRNVHHVDPVDIDNMADAWDDCEDDRFAGIEHVRIVGGVTAAIPPADLSPWHNATAAALKAWSAHCRGDVDRDAVTGAMLDLYGAAKAVGGGR